MLFVRFLSRETWNNTNVNLCKENMNEKRECPFWCYCLRRSTIILKESLCYSKQTIFLLPLITHKSLINLQLISSYSVYKISRIVQSALVVCNLMKSLRRVAKVTLKLIISIQQKLLNRDASGAPKMSPLCRLQISQLTEAIYIALCRKCLFPEQHVNWQKNPL